ncbi:MAG: S41 family peptidase [Flavobacteriales bacterium]|nr:S41 family peptidase [Flavobacteriales bacterium]
MKKILLLFLCGFTTAVLSAQESDNPLWLRYPAISPDGSKIAFCYQGDVYTVSTSGGEAKRLTIHEAYESHPVWSPDGSKIAFASMRYGNNDVFIMDAEGGSPTRLTFHSSGDSPSDFTNDGKMVIYSSSRMDNMESVLFPSGVLSELYSVPVDGGREKQILSTPALSAKYSADGNSILFYDRKGYEDNYRKHHVSSVTRDVWMYNFPEKKYSKLTEWRGEDREPVWGNENQVYFTSEQSGSFNVWKGTISGDSFTNLKQVTNLDTHPVRSLSRADNGMLCFRYDGEIYKMLEPNEPQKVNITIRSDRRYNEAVVELVNGNASDFEVSPNGKEIAFIVRGEVFVTATDYTKTKRITDTPEQERGLDFNSDGTKLLYNGERDGSWNVYEASLGREEDKYFYNATIIEEKPLVNTAAEEFQASYSPDDKEVAYLEERTTLKVKNLESGTTRTVVPGEYSYSYADGDQYYTWSPDSKWFLVQFFDNNRWNDQVGLVNASGEEKPINLTKSGYGNTMPKFGMGGKVVYWASDKAGFRSHGSWGSQNDVYALFLTEDAYKKFTLDKGDYELWKEEQKDKDKDDEDDKDDKDKKKKKDDDEEEKEKVEDLKVEWEGLEDRKVRLTIFSSFLSDFVLDKDGENLYYLTSTGEGFDLWKTQFKDKETKIFTKLDGGYSSLQFDKEFKNLFVNSKGSIKKITVSDGKTEGVSFSSEMNLNTDAERAYLFEHAWRQFKKKFYLEDLHDVDWDMYKQEYAKYLPYINNPIDFADMLSELLGEANASHTGGRFRSYDSKGDNTAALGLFYDDLYEGDGLKIAEVIGKSPVINEDGKVKAGVIIEKIDGKPILKDENIYPHFNRKAGDKTLISYYDPNSGERWDEVVEPISGGRQNQLLYERWIESREEQVERLSDGKIGYVHVRGMNSSSFRELYDKALGKHNEKLGLIVDTRFNGGGWLHDDLATFLSGEAYLQFVPRGQDNMGGEPLGKWTRPSCVLMSESNYSDAHLFPYTYKFFGIGKLIGAPVPGTGTAVWWERMQDGTVFGIPQVGMKDVKTGELMENNELQPDILIYNEPGKAASGVDQQLEAGVKHLLEIAEE